MAIPRLPARARSSCVRTEECEREYEKIKKEEKAKCPKPARHELLSR
jgi:hypothetical protein